jgi:hypothetical protein
MDEEGRKIRTGEDKSARNHFAAGGRELVQLVHLVCLVSLVCLV